MTTDAGQRRPTSQPKPPATSSHQNGAGATDPYYGHERTAKMAAAFITSLFSCPDLPPPSNALTPSGSPVPSPKLAHFVAYALHRTRLASSVTFAALFLLQRLKARFPAARGSSGHRLFISAFMIASKVVCDDTYSNKSWCVVGQGMFTLREINQMEREMCGYLEWVLNVQQQELETFTDRVQAEFGGGVGAPAASSSSSNAVVLATSNSTSASPATTSASSTASAPPKQLIVAPAPTFKARGPIKPHTPNPPTYTVPPQRTYPSPASDEVSPGSSPESSRSDTTSPASSAPHTPPSGVEDDASAPVVAGIASAPGSGSSGVQVSIPKMMQSGVGLDGKASVQPEIAGGARPFAFAAPAIW